MDNGFIDIEYETLKKAVAEIEAKQGTCDKLPSARFTWADCRMVGDKLQVSNHMPNIGAPAGCSDVRFDMILCDRLGGMSTGTSAGYCKNCLHRDEVEAHHREIMRLLEEVKKIE